MSGAQTGESVTGGGEALAAPVVNHACHDGQREGEAPR
jgi:hypothetical protein